MASLKFNRKEQHKLFFNKFKYKVIVAVPGVEFIRYCDNIDEFFSKIKRIKRQILDRNPAATYPKYYSIIHNSSRKSVSSPWILYWEVVNENINHIKYVFDFKQSVLENPDIYLRQENNVISVFSNDLSKLKHFASHFKDSIFYQVKILPKGIKYFTKEPKFKYRTFFKGSKKWTDVNIQNTLLSYVDKNKYNSNIRLSKPLIDCSAHPYYFNYYIQGFYVDYDDSQYLTVLHMIFSGVLGETFKLEKRPD